MTYWGPWIPGPNFALKNILTFDDFDDAGGVGVPVLGFARAVPIADVSVLLGLTPAEDPPDPQLGDAFRIIGREWRGGQPITLPSHSMQLTVEIFVPLAGPDTFTVYDITSRTGPGPLPPPIASGIVSSETVPVIVTFQDLPMSDFIVAVVFGAQSGAATPPRAYWIVNYPDYRYLFTSAPPLHQRQRTDGLGGGPPHAGRNLTSRQMSAFQRGTL